MYSVTKRIDLIKQPYGGYLNKKHFEVQTIDDGRILYEEENIPASLIGLAVDYLTRFLMGETVEEAFMISLMGAINLDFYKRLTGVRGMFRITNRKKAKKLMGQIRGLNRKSVISACKLVGYDVCYRASVDSYRSVEKINPDRKTIKNIIAMVERSMEFLYQYGPLVKSGFTFEGGYTDIVSSGDGDYLTTDTLWDFKVLKGEPKSKHTLQLLMYYIMGIHSINHEDFCRIKQLGIYNPRQNKIYTAKISSINPDIIEEVSRSVIGY